MNPRPLEKLFASPYQLLEKAKRDLSRLHDAVFDGDEIRCSDAMLDAAVAVFHVKDWIKAMHSDFRSAPEKFVLESRWISLCRDICHASKHFSLNLERLPYKDSRSSVDRVDQTVTAAVELPGKGTSFTDPHHPPGEPERLCRST